MADSNCSILIVDDEKINVTLFSAQLNNANYATLTANSGQEALQLAREKHPDLILLDVMMPDMDGFEVASRLKSHEATKNIPIIMVTALDDHESMLKGLECGAEEFLSKPVLTVELLLRVRNLLKLKKYQDLLASQSNQLEEQVAEGHLRLSEAQEKLVQSEKLASIGQLAAGVAHEINNPIGFVKSNMGSLKDYIDDFLTVLDQYEALEAILPPDADGVHKLRELKTSLDIAFIRDDIRHLIAQSQDGIARVAKIIQDLKDFARSDNNASWVKADLHGCLNSALNIAANEIKYKADVLKEYGALPEVECLPAQIGQVFLNILVNAAQAMPGDHGRGTITVRSGCTDDEHAWIEISDTGCGMDAAQIKRIFEPFYTTKPVGLGTGLGLSISYGIIQRHGGRIEVTSTIGQGTTFRIVLPVHQAAVENAAA
ncbi:MAG: response regulator [Rhodocyclaceae bacterium]|nr:MAG: response regulator [Rhodocyclaceae bacterium]